MEHANESPRGAHTIDEAVALRERAQKYGAAPATVTLAEAELNWLSAGAGTIEEGRALYQLCMALSGEIGTLRAQIFALGTSDSALVESLRDMSEAIATIRNANAFRDAAFSKLAEAIGSASASHPVVGRGED